MSTGFDYSMKGGWYVSSSVLYNSSGGNRFDLQQVASTTLSAKNLMPTKWNIMAQVSKEFIHLTRSGLTTVYSPNGKLLWEMSVNTDISCLLIVQSRYIIG